MTSPGWTVQQLPIYKAPACIWDASLKILFLFFLSFVYQFYAVHRLKEDGRNVIEHSNAACNTIEYHSTKEELNLKKHETHQLQSHFESIYQNNYTYSYLSTTEQGLIIDILGPKIDMMKKEENLTHVEYANLVNDCRTVHLQTSLAGYYLSGKSTYYCRYRESLLSF